MIRPVKKLWKADADSGLFCVILLLSLLVLLASSSERLMGQKIEEGAPAPQILLPSLQTGMPASLADFQGSKVMLHVFASW